MSVEEFIAKVEAVYVGDKEAKDEVIDAYENLFCDYEIARDKCKELEEDMLNNYKRISYDDMDEYWKISLKDIV